MFVLPHLYFVLFNTFCRRCQCQRSKLVMLMKMREYINKIYKKKKTMHTIVLLAESLSLYFCTIFLVIHLCYQFARHSHNCPATLCARSQIRSCAPFIYSFLSIRFYLYKTISVFYWFRARDCEHCCERICSLKALINKHALALHSASAFRSASPFAARIFVVLSKNSRVFFSLESWARY